MWVGMSESDPPPTRRRRPGGGRKPAPYNPNIPVSVAMSLEERRRIDRAALATNRTRSAFILRACYDAIERLVASGRLQSEDIDQLPGGFYVKSGFHHKPAYLEDIRPGIPGVSPITRKERERRLDAGESPAAVWEAYGDPTRGGMWDPARAGSVGECAACRSQIASGSLYCPSCGVEQ